MAKFLTEIRLADVISSRFEAETAEEVLAILTTFGFVGPIAPDAPVAAPAPTPEKAARRPRTKPTEGGVVGSIAPAAAPMAVAAPDPTYPTLNSTADIADAIRNYARRPGVGVPGVTKLIQEFKTVTGEPAKQVKDIAPSEFAAVSARLGDLLA